MFAVPSMYKSFHSFEEDPKSLSPSLPGTKADPFHLASPPLAISLIILSVAKSIYSVDADLPTFNDVFNTDVIVVCAAVTATSPEFTVIPSPAPTVNVCV